MLVADPSSVCDVCFHHFTETRECYSIPCGHLFCIECLHSLVQMICPMCRTPLGSLRRARKVHVDMSKCVDLESRTLQKIEELVISEAKDRAMTFHRAYDLSAKLHAFLKDKPPNQYALLRSIAKLMRNYASALATVTEETNKSAAVKLSFEDHIKQLEKELQTASKQLKSTRKEEPASQKAGKSAVKFHAESGPAPSPRKHERRKKRNPS